MTKKYQISNIKRQMLKWKNGKGMSLLEILVVVAIFAILGIITTRSVILTLQGSKKSESTIKIRENVDYSLSVIERQLRNARSISDCGNNAAILNYLDENAHASTLSCVNIGTSDGYIASGSGRLTSNLINVTLCDFSCNTNSTINPPSVSVNVSAIDSKASGTQTGSIHASTQIFLRNY